MSAISFRIILQVRHVLAMGARISECSRIEAAAGDDEVQTAWVPEKFRSRARLDTIVS